MISGVRLPPEALAGLVDAVAQLTRKPIGVNFLMPFLEPPGVEVASSKARVVEFFYGGPTGRWSTPPTGTARSRAGRSAQPKKPCAEDTVISEAFSAMWPNAPHRVLRSSVDAANAFQGAIVAELDHGGTILQVPRFGSPAPARTRPEPSRRCRCTRANQFPRFAGVSRRERSSASSSRERSGCSRRCDKIGFCFGAVRAR
jgi:hypothetical protein